MKNEALRPRDQPAPSAESKPPVDQPAEAPAAPGPTPRGDTTVDRQNFGTLLLVFGCIGTDLCKKIRVFQHFSKSTRLSSCNF